MSDQSRCRKCDKPLFDEIERDTWLCSSCADREYERHLERREWEHFHPDHADYFLEEKK